MRQTSTTSDIRESAALRGLSLLVASALLIAAPTAVLAVPDNVPDRVPATEIVPFTPANVDPALARRVAAKIAARGQAMRFTPASGGIDRNRTVTLAIRVGPQDAQAISVRSAIAASRKGPGGEAGAAQSITTLAKSRYNLGLSRGYESFAKPAEPALGLKRIEMPDLASFRPSDGVKETPGRLQPRLALEAESNVGRSPRTLEGSGGQAVDLGAGYRLSKSLNVTAGVRLSQERDRLAPLTDAVRDDQAVYIGTQFRF